MAQGVVANTGGRSFPVEHRQGGLYLPALDVYLDPAGPAERALVSHAHVRLAAEAPPAAFYASRETIALLQARGHAVSCATALGWSRPLDWPMVDGSGTARVSIEPAGHMLGAAQWVIDHPGGRFVYTGDYRTGAGGTHAAGAPVPCDEILVESAFALPIFRFPPRDAALRAIVAFCRGTLSEGAVPVLLAEPLGGAQELVLALHDAALPVAADGEVWRMCRAYEALGVSLGVADGRLHTNDDAEPRKKSPAVIVAPPSAQRRMRKLRSARVALASGGAILDASIEQRRADVGFPFSSHADHDNLLETIRRSGARHVTVTAGDASSFCSILRDAAFEASAIELPPHDGEDLA